MKKLETVEKTMQPTAVTFLRNTDKNAKLVTDMRIFVKGTAVNIQNRHGYPNK